MDQGSVIVLTAEPDNLPDLNCYERVISVGIADQWEQIAPDRFETSLAPHDFAKNRARAKVSGPERES